MIYNPKNIDSIKKDKKDRIALVNPEKKMVTEFDSIKNYRISLVNPNKKWLVKQDSGGGKK